MSNVWSRAIFGFGGKPVEQHQEADDRPSPVNGPAAETTVGVAATQNAAAEATAPQIDATQIADDNFVPEDSYKPPVLGYGYGDAEAIALEESAILTCATCGGIVFELDQYDHCIECEIKLNEEIAARRAAAINRKASLARARAEAADWDKGWS